jgi:hypothetical protein
MAARSSSLNGTASFAAVLRRFDVVSVMVDPR